MCVMSSKAKLSIYITHYTSLNQLKFIVITFLHHFFTPSHVPLWLHVRFTNRRSCPFLLLTQIGPVPFTPSHQRCEGVKGTGPICVRSKKGQDLRFVKRTCMQEDVRHSNTPLVCKR